MDQTSATPAVSAPAQPDAASQRSDAESSPTPPGFGARGRVRRRARFLRKARELAYRDLGGLVYSLHRFAQRNDSLVLAKLGTLSRIDAELRALEASLSERQPVTVLREAGITACPRCAAIHSGEDRFCPNCGLPMSRNVDLPIAGAATAMPAAGVSATPASSPAQTSPPATAPGPATQVTAAPPASAAQAASPAPAPATPAPIATPAAPSPAGVVSQPLSGVPSSAAAAAAPPGSPGQPIAPTQTHTAVPPAGGALGRSPVPPAAAGSPSPPGDEDQPTEIIRPPATGS